jgi:hypothetical protein
VLFPAALGGAGLFGPVEELLDLPLEHANGTSLLITSGLNTIRPS